MHPATWKPLHYYWNCFKYIGQETYKTWRWELFTSVLGCFFVAFISGNWNDFRTAMLATGMTLGCFIIWHTLRVPWLIHKSVHSNEKAPGTPAGVFGISVIALALIGSCKLADTIWRARPTEPVNMAVAAPAPVTVLFKNATPVGKGSAVHDQGLSKSQPPQSSPSPVGAQTVPNMPAVADIPYNEVGDAVLRIMKVNNDWNGAAPWAIAKLKKADTPQERERQTILIAARMNQINDQWKESAPYVQKSVADALNRMTKPGPNQLSPNESARRSQEFGEIIEAAGKMPDPAQIDDSNGSDLDPKRFDPLFNFLTALHTKLGDYPEVPTQR